MPATSEVKQGFWLGLGIMGAFVVLGFAQMWLMRAVSSKHG